MAASSDMVHLNDGCIKKCPAKVAPFDDGKLSEPLGPPPKLSTPKPTPARTSPCPPSRKNKLAPLGNKASASSGINIIKNLPDDVLVLIALHVLDCVIDFHNLGAVSRDWRSATTAIVPDENALLWEIEFKRADHVLHSCMSLGGDKRSTWRARLMAHSAMMKIAAPAGPQVFIEAVLYKHPTQGFLLNLGEVNQAAFITAIRRPGSTEEGVFSSIELLLKPLGLPVISNEEPAPTILDVHKSVMAHSINGTRVLDIFNLEELTNIARTSGDYASWRFLMVSSAHPEHIPAECRFGQRA